MSYTSGTAADPHSLFNALVTFLTTDATLTAAGQNWTLLRRDTFTYNAQRDYAELKGPGLAGADSIYVQLTYFQDPANDTYCITVQGSQGYLSSVSVGDPGNQPNSCVIGGGQWAAHFFNMPLYNNSTPYWFIANGRRFIVAAKVGSYWSSLYAGFILPYGTPSQYPYPLYIAANSCDGARYSDPGQYVSNSGFWYSYRPGGAVLKPDGNWFMMGAYSSDQGGVLGYNYGHFWPWWRNPQQTNFGGVYGTDKLVPAPDGSYPLLPAIMFGHGGNAALSTMLGELDGVFMTTGFGAAAADTFTVGSDTYLLIQRALQNSPSDFVAIKLA